VTLTKTNVTQFTYGILFVMGIGLCISALMWLMVFLKHDYVTSDQMFFLWLCGVNTSLTFYILSRRDE
jgi:hypothetical protein